MIVALLGLTEHEWRLLGVLLAGIAIIALFVNR